MRSIAPSQFLSILSCLLQDIEDILELDRGVLSGDFDKISRSINSRGTERIVFLRLPELCSDFELSLESGQERFSKGEFVQKGRLKLLRPLLDTIFMEDGSLQSEPCFESIRCFRQVLKCFKKFKIECPAETIMEKIHEFKQIEADLPPPDFSWGNVDFDLVSGYPSLDELDRFRHYRQNLHSESTFDEIWGPEGIKETLGWIQFVADRLAKSFRIHWNGFRPKHGPGAVSEKFGSSKYEFPSWPERLERIFPFSEWGVLNGLNIPFEEYVESQPAKLIDVPKDFRGPRLIASEPISSQYIQQGIMGSIRKSLKTSILRHCYDPLSQEHSRRLVLSSSADRSFSTIDLSSASDRLSCWLVERIFRKNIPFLQALNAARTPDLLYPDGEIVQLRKFAAQGAAFTFPIQSLIYAIICIGVIYSQNPFMRFNDVARMVRVYGDDIIVPTIYFKRVCQALEACFLKVNPKKSFSQGSFRESCGMDAYGGHDVTAVSVLAFYHPRRPEDTVSTIECSNNLYIGGYIRASNRLLETIPKGIRANLPWVSPGTNVQMGVFGSGIPRLKTRQNLMWFVPEVQVLAVESKITRTVPSGALQLLQWLHQKPMRFTGWVLQPVLPQSLGEVIKVKARYRLRWVPRHSLGRRYDVRS